MESSPATLPGCIPIWKGVRQRWQTTIPIWNGCRKRNFDHSSLESCPETLADPQSILESTAATLTSSVPIWKDARQRKLGAFHSGMPSGTRGNPNSNLELHPATLADLHSNLEWCPARVTSSIPIWNAGRKRWQTTPPAGNHPRRWKLPAFQLGMTFGSTYMLRFIWFIRRGQSSPLLQTDAGATKSAAFQHGVQKLNSFVRV
jgi:hypothetical protein